MAQTQNDLDCFCSFLIYLILNVSLHQAGVIVRPHDRCYILRFCQLGGWIESTSADIVLTGGIVSISRRQPWSEWNETAVYLSQGPIMCVCYSARCACFCVYSLEHVCETYINAQDVYVKVLFVFFRCVLRFKLVRRFLQHEARSPPRPPYGHLETLICAVYARARVCVSSSSQCLCV